jgi:hypothetical protein
MQRFNEAKKKAKEHLHYILEYTVSDEEEVENEAAATLDG